MQFCMIEYCAVTHAAGAGRIPGRFALPTTSGRRSGSPGAMARVQGAQPIDAKPWP